MEETDSIDRYMLNNISSDQEYLQLIDNLWDLELWLGCRRSNTYFTH